MPINLVQSISKVFFTYLIAIRQQHRIGLFISYDRYIKNGQHIRTIKVVSDSAKTLSLTLSTVISTGAIQALQRFISHRIDNRNNGNFTLIGEFADC